jgi:hypothetical protein
MSNRTLAFTVEHDVLRFVDYRNLGSEELGSVYESLLELHPEIDAEAVAFSLTTAAGNERKTTGSYYPPTPLILSRPSLTPRSTRYSRTQYPSPIPKLPFSASRSSTPPAALGISSSPPPTALPGDSLPFAPVKMSPLPSLTGRPSAT